MFGINFKNGILAFTNIKTHDFKQHKTPSSKQLLPNGQLKTLLTSLRTYLIKPSTHCLLQNPQSLRHSDGKNDTKTLTDANIV